MQENHAGQRCEDDQHLYRSGNPATPHCEEPKRDKDGRHDGDGVERHHMLVSAQRGSSRRQCNHGVCHRYPDNCYLRCADDHIKCKSLASPAPVAAELWIFAGHRADSFRALPSPGPGTGCCGRPAGGPGPHRVQARAPVAGLAGIHGHRVPGSPGPARPRARGRHPPGTQHRARIGQSAGRRRQGGSAATRPASYRPPRTSPRHTATGQLCPPAARAASPKLANSAELADGDRAAGAARAHRGGIPGRETSTGGHARSNEQNC